MLEISLVQNRDAGPVYRQIAGQIRSAIEAHRLALGERLPTIRDLSERLGVNRDTVALAYDELARDGLVEATVGRGTFVAGGAGARSFEPQLSPLIERLLVLERALPRFGSTDAAVALHSVVPDPRLYPAAAFRKTLNREFQKGGAELLLYGEPQGLLRLRRAVAEHLKGVDLVVSPDELVLCHGASQGIVLALRLFAAPGDVVALEEPTYNHVLAACSGLGFETTAIPMREEGLDLGALERTLARPEVKLLYTIPSFHNPLGITTSLAHRQALLAIAARCGKPVVEDAYEQDLRIDGRPVAPLAALDTTGGVVHLASFSKSLFPGVRVGAMAARGRLVDALLALKQSSDLSDAMPLQAGLAGFLESGDYAKHLARLRRVMRGRRDALLEALAQYLPPGARFARPEGGYQVWVELPDAIDTSELLPDAVAAGVLFAPGAQFHHDRRPSHGLRLRYAMADEAELREGAAVLGEVVTRRGRADGRRAQRVSV